MASVLLEIRRRARWVVPQLLAVGLVAYFLFHLVQGDRGIRAYLQLTEELDRAERAAALLGEQVARERVRVERLSSGSLDLDLLEERAHLALGYLRSEEYVIFTDR